MAWVRGIREVRNVRVSIDGDLVGLRRGPVMTRKVRQKIDLMPASWPRVLSEHAELPSASGAGPCGALARRACVPGVLAWSVTYLAGPLRAYYAAYVEPLHFGAKTGPRGRRAA